VAWARVVSRVVIDSFPCSASVRRAVFRLAQVGWWLFVLEETEIDPGPLHAFLKENDLVMGAAMMVAEFVAIDAVESATRPIIRTDQFAENRAAEIDHVAAEIQILQISHFLVPFRLCFVYFAWLRAILSKRHQHRVIRGMSRDILF